MPFRAVPGGVSLRLRVTPRSAFSIASGETSRMKAVLAAGEPEALLARFEAWAARLPERRN